MPTVPGRGNPEAKIAIVGEQPGYTEVRWSPPTPFVGPAGKVLDSCLQLAGIARSDCYLTNVIKTLAHPLSYYISEDHITEEGQRCIIELGKELSNLRPNVVVACGNVPLLALCSRTGITKWRGSILESTLVPNLKVIPTIHPATCIPPKSVYTNKPLIVFDLKRALKESTNPAIVRESRHVMIKPSYHQAIDTLERAYKRALDGAILYFDIEVINEELDCFSIAWNPHEAISVPLNTSHGDYFTIDQELSILRLLNQIISDPNVSLGGANIIFDLQFMLTKFGMIPRGDLHCTQVAQKILTPDYPAGLDFVTVTHTDIPYYKQDGKKWLKMGVGSWETWWTYNGMDSIAAAAAHPSQLSDLKQLGNIETYDRQRRLIPPLIYMSTRGIKVDVQGILDQKERELAEIDTLTEELNKVVGHEINANSPQQLAHYFYKELGHPPYKKRTSKGWVVTTDVDALKRLARKDIKAAQILLKLRRLNKRVGTYLNVSKVDPDSRYRSSYNPVGAETGRLSSRETIFGSGGNQQNWPHDLLQYFLFDRGYIGYSFDLSQAENRIVAYVGGIVQMIEAFEKGIDLHRMTAALILGKSIEDVSDEEGSCPLGDGTSSERQWGKKANHSLNYDFGYRSFALLYEMPESEAKWIVEQYHRAYPGVRQNYHTTVQNLLKTTRIVTNCYGRKRLFMGPVVPNPPEVPHSACAVTYKEAYAQIPQSTVADKINEDGVEFIYYNSDPLFRHVELLTQIHDSIVFQSPVSVPWTIHAEILTKIKSSLERLIYWHETPVPIPADLSIGLNMYKKQMIEVKSKNFPSTIDSLSELLRNSYVQLKEKTT